MLLAVYDMDTPAIHFAHYANCGTNLQEIPTGDNAAARFKGECSEDDIPSDASASDNDEDDEDAASHCAVGGSLMWVSVALVAAYHIAGPFL